MDWRTIKSHVSQQGSPCKVLQVNTHVCPHACGMVFPQTMSFDLLQNILRAGWGRCVLAGSVLFFGFDRAWIDGAAIEFPSTINVASATHTMLLLERVVNTMA